MRQLLAGLIVLCATAAQAQIAPEVSIGVTQYGKAIDGRWYQAPFPHTLDLRSASAAVGLRYETGRQVGPFDSLAIRAGYEYTGKASSDAEATASDANYAACSAGREPCWPMSHWHGRGDVQGFYLTLQPGMRDGVGFFVEAGVYLYRPRWSVDIPDWIGTPDDKPHLVHVTHSPKWQVSPVLGFGLRRGAWAIAYTIRRISADGDDYPAIFDKGANSLFLSYEF